MSSLVRTYRRAYKRRQNDWMEQMRKAAKKAGNTGVGTGLKQRKGLKPIPVPNMGVPSPSNTPHPATVTQRKGER